FLGESAPEAAKQALQPLLIYDFGWKSSRVNVPGRVSVPLSEGVDRRLWRGEDKAPAEPAHDSTSDSPPSLIKKGTCGSFSFACGERETMDERGEQEGDGVPVEETRPAQPTVVD